MTRTRLPKAEGVLKRFEMCRMVMMVGFAPLLVVFHPAWVLLPLLPCSFLPKLSQQLPFSDLVWSDERLASPRLEPWSALRDLPFYSKLSFCYFLLASACTSLSSAGTLLASASTLLAPCLHIASTFKHHCLHIASTYWHVLANVSNCFQYANKITILFCNFRTLSANRPL